MRENRLRTLFAQKKLALSGWVSMGNSLLAEVVANSGYDAVTVDLQHGLFSVESAIPMLQAISTTEAVPLVRCADNNLAEINKLLDAGAYGVICPLVNTAADAERFVRACHYSPRGGRSYGPARGFMYGGADYFTHANRTILTLAMIETNEGYANAEAILKVPDLDGIFIGPSDLAIEMGLAPDAYETQELNDAIRSLVALARGLGKYVGIFAGTMEMARRVKEFGMDLVVPGTDIQQLKAEGARRIAALR
ncbi:2,4-dihydroxyhept-2-ene-1,7-dioic acid aldolase [Herbaspirillum sp. LeCh32-8]|uniref:HpcH/HpaI aldolase family protein n=1 Tax=Herbaspirillum sp. LeCh32-8 TaxID=2821356 RepID=UPI001AEA3C6B|nr:aldolase/citrate lyase family protein [Herbaspirillum sp. LeCh32-8]MBP0598532.1 2,4-dihydroxyhept-2-ene-1,7-dioic acid aldolase [Herbaspirillum sp. LeCh32-8]